MKCLQLQIASCLLCLTKNMGKIMFKYSWKYLFLCSTEEKKCMQVRNDMKVRKWLQIFNFLVNDSFNAGSKWQTRSVQTKAQLWMWTFVHKIVHEGEAEMSSMWLWIAVRMDLLQLLGTSGQPSSHQPVPRPAPFTTAVAFRSCHLFR